MVDERLEEFVIRIYKKVFFINGKYQFSDSVKIYKIIKNSFPDFDATPEDTENMCQSLQERYILYRNVYDGIKKYVYNDGRYRKPVKYELPKPSWLEGEI